MYLPHVQKHLSWEKKKMIWNWKTPLKIVKLNYVPKFLQRHFKLKNKPWNRESKTLQNKSEKKKKSRDFTGGPVVKNLPANAEDTSSTPGLGKSTCLRAAKPPHHMPELTSCNYCSLHMPEPVLHKRIPRTPTGEWPLLFGTKTNAARKTAQQEN